MLPYTGDYTEHIDPEKPSLTFYSFTPRPLMSGDMYQMDEELAALLIEAHRNIGFLEGLVMGMSSLEAACYCRIASITFLDGKPIFSYIHNSKS